MQEYNNTDRQIHQLCQTLAKLNRTFVEAKEDDSHTNLTYDAVTKRIYGRWMDVYIFALNLELNQLEIINTNRTVIQSFSIIGQSQDQIENEIINYLPAIGFGNNDFREPLHFTITEYDFIEKPYAQLEKPDVRLWHESRLLANQACQLVLDTNQVEGEIRIWPHHFDTGIYIEPTEQTGLGFGFAMQDSMINEPYYYFTAYPLNGQTVDYQKFEPSAIGEWVITEHWKGAILRMSESSLQTLLKFIKRVNQLYLNN